MKRPQYIELRGTRKPLHASAMAARISRPGAG
jgi:hypothetical protein